MSALPPHLSFSAYGSWVRCGKAFELERIVRAPRRPAWWFIGGSLVHDITEELDKALFFDPSVTFDVDSLVHERLDAAVKKEAEEKGVSPDDWLAGGRQPNKQRYDHWKKAAPEMVRRWLEFRETPGWRFWEYDEDSPGIEFKVNVELGGQEFLGFIDRVVVLPSGELAVLDIKTGKSTDKEPLQLGTYALAMEQMGYPRPSWGYFWKAINGELVGPIPLEKFTEDFVSRRFNAARWAMENGIFLPNVGQNCGTCGVAAACYAVDGAESAQYDPLDPNYQGAAA